MKTLTMRSLIAVAALAVAAASASAQTYTAKVPMAFSAGERTMAPGTYQFDLVTAQTGRPLLTVRNVATHRGALLMATPGKTAPSVKTDGKAILTFQCLDGNCALSQIWNGRDTSTYSLPGLKVRPSQAERIATISVELTKAD